MTKSQPIRADKSYRNTDLPEYEISANRLCHSFICPCISVKLCNEQKVNKISTLMTNKTTYVRCKTIPLQIVTICELNSSVDCKLTSSHLFKCWASIFAYVQTKYNGNYHVDVKKDIVRKREHIKEFKSRFVPSDTKDKRQGLIKHLHAIDFIVILDLACAKKWPDFSTYPRNTSWVRSCALDKDPTLTQWRLNSRFRSMQSLDETGFSMATRPTWISPKESTRDCTCKVLNIGHWIYIKWPKSIYDFKKRCVMNIY